MVRCAIVLMLVAACGGHGSHTSLDARGDDADASDIGDAATDSALDGAVDAMPHGTLSADPPDPAGAPCAGRMAYPALPVRPFDNSYTSSAIELADVNGDTRLDALINTAGDIRLALGNGDGTFGAATTVYALSNAVAPRLRDVNGDTKPDLIVGGRQTMNAYVLLNNGSGAFGAAQAYATGVYADVIEVEDLNNDGKRDLLVFNASSRVVSVLLATSTGYGAASSFSIAGTQTSDFALGDLSGDGRPDVVVSTTGAALSVSINTGAGAFNAPVAYSTSAGAGAIAIRDLNHDAKPDVVVTGAASSGSAVAVHLNLGSGVLGTKTEFTVGSMELMRFVAVADVNSDTHPDVVTSGFSGSLDDTQVLLGTGTGSLGAPTHLAPDTSKALALADVNADGAIDLVTGGIVGLATYLNTKTSILFDQRQILESGQPARTARIFDINGDGHGDLVFVGTDFNSQGHVKTRLSTGTSFSTTVTTYSLGILSPRVAIRSDLDNDGDLDLVVAGYKLVALVNSGAGSLALATAMPLADAPGALIDGDFDNDGWRDLIAYDSDGTSAYVRRFHGNGNGTFAAPSVVFSAPNILAIARGDIDKDGLLDLLVSHTSTTGPSDPAGVSVLRGQANGTFATPVFVAYVNHPPWGMLVRDVNNDGSPDVVDWGSAPVTAFGNSTATFAAPAFAQGLGNHLDSALADVNGDGVRDVISAGYHRVMVTLGNADGTYQTPYEYEAAGLAFSLAVDDVDADGRLDIVVAHDRDVSILYGHCMP